MFKKLLYLYNDGHNPFPSGRGGLGYHLPQYPKVIHGEGLSDEESDEESKIFEDADPSTNKGKKIIIKKLIEEFEGKDIQPIETTTLKNITDVLKLEPKNLNSKKIEGIQETIDKVDELLKNTEPKPEPKIQDTNVYKDINEYNIDDITEKFYRMINEGFKTSNFTDEQKEKLLNYIITQKNDDYHKFQKNDIKRKTNNAFVDTNVDKQLIEIAMEELEIEPTINPEKQTVQEFDDEITTIKKENNLPNKGIAFEYKMINDEQKLLKDETETQSEFYDISTNQKFYKNGKPIMIPVDRESGNEHLLDNTLYDAYSTDCDIEFKYYPDSDECSVQLGKFTGNNYFIPYFIVVNKEIKLYNIWSTQIGTNGGWVNDTNYKDVYIMAQLDDGKYKFKINQSKYGDYIVPYEPENIEKRTTHDGKQLFKISKYDMINDNYFKPDTKRTGFRIIQKSRMKKI
jgi:hypothetical protein